MNKQLNLQDEVLNYVRKNNVQVTIYLTNGFQFKGFVKGFDSFIIIIECDGRQQLVYKHAVSTISPSTNINLLSICQKEFKDE